MPVTWRHRIVRVFDDEPSIRAAVLRLVEDGWIFVAGSDSEPGMTDLVFRRAATKRVWA
jgi:hypothetical protein